MGLLRKSFLLWLATAVLVSVMLPAAGSAGASDEQVSTPQPAARRPFCTVPRQPVKVKVAARGVVVVPEVEPNDTPATAQMLAAGASPSQVPDMDVTGSISSAQDVDYYRFVATKGDVIGVAVIAPGFDPDLALADAGGLIQIYNDDWGGALGDGTSLYPTQSPLPIGQVPTDSIINYVAPANGQYIMRVRPVGGLGGYTLQIRARRPFLETQSVGIKQAIYVDFSGPTINPAVIFPGSGAPSSATLSPLVNFMTNWGLTAGQEDQVIDAILARIKTNFDKLRLPTLNGNEPVDNVNGHMDVAIFNSRDDAPMFGRPYVTRVIIGGTVNELGINTVGIAESIDPGNFDPQKTAVVLLDSLSDVASDPDSVNSVPLAGGKTIIDAIGMTVGNIASHELGHCLGCFHTEGSDAIPCLMDTGLMGGMGAAFFCGVGGDGIFGTNDDVDLGYVIDEYNLGEMFGVLLPPPAGPGLEHCDTRVAFALCTGTTGSNVNRILPDLTIDSLTVPATLLVGTPFQVQVEVRNIGVASSISCNLALFLNQPTPANSSAGAAVIAVVPALAAGQATLLTLNAVYTSAGSFTLSGLVDADDVNQEMNKLNNQWYQPVTVLPNSTALQIVAVQKVENPPGLNATFTVQVANIGTTLLNYFTVGFWENRITAPTTSDTPDQALPVSGLAPGATATVTFTLPARTTPGAGLAWFLADNTGVVANPTVANRLASVAWGVATSPPVSVSPLTGPAVGSAGQALTFTAMVTDPNPDLVHYLWDFGDGQSQETTTSTITHAYANQGLYTVTLTISDGPFNSVTQTCNVQVVSNVVINLGTVSLSGSKGRFKFFITPPAGLAYKTDRLKGVVISGDPGKGVHVRVPYFSGKAKTTGQFTFVVEFSSKPRHVVTQVQYLYTVIK